MLGVYARLLQLHMKLSYLPLILLVPISNNDARYIHPGLFLNYPDECKRAINADVWSVTLPKPPLKIKAQKLFKNDIKPGPVNKETLLTDLFAAEAKVKDLIKAFDFHSLVYEPELGVSEKRGVGTGGAIHSTKISRNFGQKLNGSVRSDRKSFEKTGPPFEVDHFSRSDRLEFWLNGSRPGFWARFCFIVGFVLSLTVLVCHCLYCNAVLFLFYVFLYTVSLFFML